jgi:polyphosphate kinase 2
VELCYLQDWLKAAGARVIVVFEGRDAAGKGGTIKAIAERVSPRVFRVIALPAPSDRQKTQMFIQRYVEHFTAAGEIVIFDRSWYNRAGVERVMGFVSEKEAERFLAICPEIEKYITDAGIMLIKFWLEVGPDEQERRFHARVNDPLRQWKLSPMDLESYQRWYDYSRARDMMLKATDTDHAPWHIVRSDDKRRARLNCISGMLELIAYKKTSRPKVKLPRRSTKGRYDDQASLRGRNFCIGEILIALRLLPQRSCDGALARRRLSGHGQRQFARRTERMMPKWVKLWVCQGLSYNLLRLNGDYKLLADTPSARRPVSRPLYGYRLPSVRFLHLRGELRECSAPMRLRPPSIGDLAFEKLMMGPIGFPNGHFLRFPSGR